METRPNQLLLLFSMKTITIFLNLRDYVANSHFQIMASDKQIKIDSQV